MSTPIAYTVFHINMAFSSIEEEERSTVIERCYWPLLKLAEGGFPIGIEATSFSLKTINELDPSWIAKLRELIKVGAIELVGSGYIQMIAPLVPAEITRWNLRLGQQDYQNLLRVTPSIALVNEQAYAPGLVPLYLEAGFKAVMMDWAEPASHNKGWQRAYARRPQRVKGARDTEIAMLWSDAISFQKFQRYAHGELDAEEYFEFLSLQLSDGAQAFPLYTSDAEIFDYRPGRFGAEAKLEGFSEYERIRLLLEALQKSEDLQLGLPSEALKRQRPSDPVIKLETPVAPVPVKKQRKYNLLRWAVSGQNDLSLNTHCWRLYEDLKTQDATTDEDWRQLCGLWASDFRTHITEKRWQKLNACLPVAKTPSTQKPFTAQKLPPDIRVERSRRFLAIETDASHLVLNVQRGLTIQAFGMGPYGGSQAGAPNASSLVGTMAHGFYKDIAFGADFYSGHFIFEPAGRHKVTDLVRVEPECSWLPDEEAVSIECVFETPWGKLTKTILCFMKKHKIEVSYKGPIPLPLDGSFRLGHVTLNPRAFDVETLYYAAHSGGDLADTHLLWDGGLLQCDHGAAVSRLISATTGVGMTKGYLELGDQTHFVRLSMNRTDAAGVGLVTSKTVDDSFFVRAAVSLCEVDETLRRNLSSIGEQVDDPKLKFAIELGVHS